MKRVLVQRAFHLIATNTDHKPGDIIEVSDEQLAKIKAVNINMVEVLGEVEETPVEETPVEETPAAEKPKRTRKPKQQ